MSNLLKRLFMRPKWEYVLKIVICKAFYMLILPFITKIGSNLIFSLFQYIWCPSVLFIFFLNTCLSFVLFRCFLLSYPNLTEFVFRPLLNMGECEKNISEQIHIYIYIYMYQETWIPVTALPLMANRLEENHSTMLIFSFTDHEMEIRYYLLTSKS